jgi:hypothetical protein
MFYQAICINSFSDEGRHISLLEMQTSVVTGNISLLEMQTLTPFYFNCVITQTLTLSSIFPTELQVMLQSRCDPHALKRRVKQRSWFS